MDKRSEAVALAGIAQNLRQPTDVRLACASQALDFYIERADKLESLGEWLQDQIDSLPGSEHRTKTAYREVFNRLTKILEGSE